MSTQRHLKNINGFSKLEKGNIGILNAFFRIFIPTIIHYFLQFPFSIIMMILGFISSFFNFKWGARKVIELWGYGIFLSLGCRLRVIGREHLSKKINYLVVVNHASIFDIPAVGAVFPHGRWMGRAYLLRIPVLGNLLKHTGYIPVEPRNWRMSLEAISNALEGVEGGGTVMMFPEGTRTLDGNIGQFRKGFIRILRGSGADLLPVTLNGMYSLKAKKRRYLTISQRPEVIVHPPFTNSELISLTDNMILEKVRTTIVSAYSN